MRGYEGKNEGKNGKKKDYCKMLTKSKLRRRGLFKTHNKMKIQITQELTTVLYDYSSDFKRDEHPKYHRE